MGSVVEPLNIPEPDEDEGLPFDGGVIPDWLEPEWDLDDYMDDYDPLDTGDYPSSDEEL